MNIQELRQSLKSKWLNYYEQNRSWLVKMRVWANYGGVRRPSSGFILATLSVLEPDFDEILAFVMELNNNPDEIVTALGLNFNPDKELSLINSQMDLALTPLEEEQQYPEEVVTSMALTVYDASPVSTKEHNASNVVVMPTLHQPVPQVVGGEQPVIYQKAATNGKMNIHPTIHKSSSPAGQVFAVTLEVPKKDKPLTSLALTTIKPQNGKVVSSLAITTEVPGKPKTLIIPRTVAEIPQNGQYVHKKPSKSAHKVHSKAHTNASNLASWVDEFCLGSQWNSEEAISVHRG
ncbi:DUF5331 domain-containing protein [Aliinostoc sp. HNIBRCY26]|uniref:DUF5331 domain-containing protein n=1 Tax=Aliinostoc sp. HNIBRCY26 TaxID=3418997 RepID=UPI003CFE5265